MATPQARNRVTKNRVANYCRVEPSFTVAFAAWELGLDHSTVNNHVNRLLAEGKLVQVEARSGPYAAVYRWRTKKEREQGMKLNVQTTNTPASELKDREVAHVTQAPAEKPKAR